MSGKPSSQTEQAVLWLKEDKFRTLKEALRQFKASRLSILVQLGQEWLRSRNGYGRERNRMYHPTITKLDSAAIELHPFFPEQSKQLFILTGGLQKALVQKSPYPTKRRFFDAQWCWALGHIGILYQVIRWFKKNEPDTELVLETKGAIANQYFLSALSTFVTIHGNLPPDMIEEAKFNACYFGCPDGVHHVHDFMKVAEKECEGIHLLELTEAQKAQTDELLSQLGIKRPYVCIQARHLEYEPKRNVSLEQAEKALEYYRSLGYSVVSTGLDMHPINQKIPSVQSLPNRRLASFLLSASCDQFIGSDSGAWTVPWAFRRPVELINDEIFAAWIYP